MNRDHISPWRAAGLPAVVLLLFAGLAAPVAAQNGPLGSPIPGRPLGEALEDPSADAPVSFIAHQLAFARVAEARDSAEESLRALFVDKGVAYPARELFFRVFKHEREFEVWARSHPDAPFTLIRTYPVCSLPGQLGPKRRLGDLQVPEGFYYIDHFNPRSEFHLSLRVSYPNTADRMRRGALSLGGDIFIHGGCATVGCVPIEDRNIREVYWLAVQATEAGQRLIPVHIFPARLDDSRLRWLADTFDPEPDLLAFWHNLARGYAFFERTRRVPWITVAENGEYAVPGSPELAADSLVAETAADAVAADSAPTAPPDSLASPPSGSLPQAKTDSARASGGTRPDG